MLRLLSLSRYYDYYQYYYLYDYYYASQSSTLVANS